MTTLTRDVLYAVRLLARQPGFAAVTLVTLALGIGGATAIFSVVHAVLLRPLPYHDESRVVMVWETEPAAGVDKMVGTPGNFQDWRAQTRTIDHLGALMDYDGDAHGPRRAAPRRRPPRGRQRLRGPRGASRSSGARSYAEDETADANDALLLAHRSVAGVCSAPTRTSSGERITLNDQPRTDRSASWLRPSACRAVRTISWIPLVFTDVERPAARLAPAARHRTSQARRLARCKPRPTWM